MKRISEPFAGNGGREREGRLTRFEKRSLEFRVFPPSFVVVSSFRAAVGKVVRYLIVISRESCLE